MTALGPAAFPLLNVGSHTAEFRTRTQPWIERYLFGPWRAAGHAVTHLDLQAAPGVDLVGDLSEPAFAERVRALQFRTVLSNNLLEHVPDPAAVCRLLRAAVAPGGYVVLTVPHRFPYHADPIDTLYRPSPTELAAEFPDATIVAQAKLWCGNLTTYTLARLWSDPRALVDTLRRRARGEAPTPIASKAAPGGPWRWLPWLVRPFVQTCLILRVPGGQ
jgi:SAM-dependent methyltransferase